MYSPLRVVHKTISRMFLTKILRLTDQMATTWPKKASIAHRLRALRQFFFNQIRRYSNFDNPFLASLDLHHHGLSSGSRISFGSHPSSGMVGTIGTLRALWLLLQKDFKVMRRRLVYFIFECVAILACLLCILLLLKLKPYRVPFNTESLDTFEYTALDDNNVGVSWPSSLTPREIAHAAQQLSLACQHLNFTDSNTEEESVNLIVKTFQSVPEPKMDYEVVITSQWDIQLPPKDLHYNMFGTSFGVGNKTRLDPHVFKELEKKALFTQECINKAFLNTVKPDFAPKLNITLGNMPSTSLRLTYYFTIGLVTMVMMISTVGLAMQEVASEKQRGIHTYLRAVGLPRFVFYVSHYMFALVKILAIIAAQSILSSIFDKGLTLKFIPVLVLYGNVICAYGFIGATLLKKSVYILAFMLFMTVPYFYIADFVFENIFFNSSAMLVLCLLNPTLAYFYITSHYDLAFLHDQDIAIVKGYDKYLPLLYPYMALVIHLVLLIPLAFYIDAVMGTGGMPKLHPLFFLGFRRRQKTVERSEKRTSYASDCDRYQPPSASGELLLEVNNLVKTWANGETAVDDISFKVYAGQVVTLLGHNGAGKTTTFSCLTGFLKPTSGSVELFGDGRVGYCPQFDPLFSKLTVIEHMEFYCTLFTGTCPDDTVLQATMEKIELGQFESTYAHDLSGGMKRRLSFGIALLSGCNVMLLDEPTVGVDTSTRRSIMKLIKNLKAKRAVVMTTHHMDEAEALSDHINIMCKGKIICSGSNEFLKSKFGAGFLLVVDLSLSPREEAEILANTAKRILYLVKNYCSEAEFYGPVSNQFNIVIPVEFRPTFAEMFAELESKRAELNIDSFDVMMNTLDQVFVNVTKEAADADTDNEPNNDRVTEFIEQVADVRTGASLILLQIGALMLRKFNNFRRDFLQVVTTLIVVSCFTIVCAQCFAERGSHPGTVFKAGSANLALSNYFEMGVGVVTLETGYVSPLAAPLESLNSSNIHRIEKESMNGLHDQHLPKKLAKKVFKLPVPGLYYLVDMHDVIILKNKNFFGGEYVGLQTLFDALLPNAINATLTYVRTESEPVKSKSLNNAYAITVAFGFTFIAAVNVFLYLSEHVNGIHHLYARTRLTKLLYWLTILLGDVMFYSIIQILLIILSFATSSLHYSCLVPFSLKMFAMILPFVLQSYAFAVVFKSAIPTVIAMIVTNVLGYSAVLLGALVPHLKYLHVFSPSVITGVIAQDMQVKCNRYKAEANRYAFDYKRRRSLPLSVLLPGCIAFYAVILLVALTAPMLTKLLTRKNDESDELDNEDITKERKRVEEEGVHGFVITAKGLKKQFQRCCKRKFTAVFNTTFGISKGECFGLMGTNGAGKSTVFNMLTTKIRPTAGNAYVNGVSIMKNPRFGFCPQGDAFFPDLTVSEFFLLFARLNGINNAQSVVYVLMDCLRLVNRKNVLVNLCSGGEKRRITLGIALITDINVLMLDEPTTGVDPYTRRYIWDTLLALRENGSTMLLTTHSMEECEALCTRILFLAKGHMMALGTAQYLKHTMGDEYGLTVILKCVNIEVATQLNTRFSEVFDATMNSDVAGITLRWTFKKTDEPLSELYTKLDTVIEEIEGVETSQSLEAISSEASTEEKKRRFIVDSLIVAVTLEDVFLRLADKVTEVKSII
uniref:ABC transporter domain-containing protein n=1 Tax=Panagrellus redivivus TaxID=6233 RepID=A0A7E4URJ6_PANRE